MSQHWPAWLPLRKDLSELSPYGAPQLEIPVRLNTNENPYSLDERMQKHLLTKISEHLPNLNRYPDRDARQLREALARFINKQSGTRFEEKNIWPANGSNEVLQSLVVACEGSAIGSEPSYSMHPLICKIIGRSWINIDRRSDFTIDVSSILRSIEKNLPAMVFLATPNNPTGSSTSLAEIESLAVAALRVKALVIIDEAYAEFASTPSAVTLIEKHPNIVVVRTMSKAFAFAGARVGYLVARPEVIEAMMLVRLPYHLSALTQAAALAALDLSDDLLANVSRIIESRNQLASQMRELGLNVVTSDSNFLLFSGFTREPRDLWSGLVKRGVLIRDVGVNGHLRVTIGTPAENETFLMALKTLL